MQTNRVNSQPNFKGKSFLMVKPHAVKENKTADILSYLSQNTKGLKATRFKEVQLTRPQAEAHYAEHKGKSHFEPIVNALLEGPVLMIEMKGRKVIQKTQALKKEIRAKFGNPENPVYNALHMSDSNKAGKRELNLHMPKEQNMIQKFLNKFNPSKK